MKEGASLTFLTDSESLTFFFSCLKKNSQCLPRSLRILTVLLLWANKDKCIGVWVNNHIEGSQGLACLFSYFIAKISATLLANFCVLKFLGILDLITSVNISVLLTISLTRKTNKKESSVFLFSKNYMSMVTHQIFTFNANIKLLTCNWMHSLLYPQLVACINILLLLLFILLKL